MTKDMLQTYCLDLIQAARQWRRLADAVVRPHGLSEATALPLILIARRAGVRQTALAEAMGLEGPSLVRLLDQLCAAGLVIREPDRADRRAKCLNLTPRGRGLASRIGKELDAHRREVFAKVAPQDLEASRRVFEQLARATGPSSDRVDEAAA